MSKNWYRQSVIYQIYPRSFCDSNGDGIGDINGITSKLEYIKELGADVVWLSPVYKSPMRDNGYDVSDYMEINPEFGTMEDFDLMLESAHNLELKIIMDMPVNHTSHEHPWFKECKSNPNSQKREYYIWRNGYYDDPPNDWVAKYGGCAWTLDEASSQYYLGLFSQWQPDLNWENKELRFEIYDIMRFWLDKGVDGLRLDSIALISKPQTFPDGNEKKLVPNGPRVHEFLREMKREVFSKYDIVTIGDTAAVNVEEALKYKNLNMVLQYEVNELDGGESFKWNDNLIDLIALKKVFSRWQKGLYEKGWNALFWCNHEQPRIVSRLGNEGEHREKSAKMLATCLHFLQGTVFIYQGEELGMTNTPFADITQYRDIESINAYEALVTESKHFSVVQMLYNMRLKSRDNARTPMQWNDGPNAGFSKQSAKESWIMLNPNYKEINAEEQIPRADSVFTYYQELIKLRKTMKIITYGSFELLLPEHSDLFVYSRSYQDKKLLVVCNFTNEDRMFVLPEGFTGKKVLITNEDTHRIATTLLSTTGNKERPSVNIGPYGAVVYQRV